MMWIINSKPPFIHKLHATVNTAYTFSGLEEAKQAAREFNELLKQTELQAQSLRKETQGIVDNIHEIVKLSPKDSLEGSGVG